MAESPEGGARAVAVAVPSAAEVAVLFIPGGSAMGPVNLDNPNAPVASPGLLIRGTANITTGAAGTNPTIRCRRGNGIGGAQVGTSQTQTQAVATSGTQGFTFQDNANPNPQNGYTISVSLGAGTATVNEIVGSVDDGT